MKIALVHDYLTQRGGAERVFELLCRYFPQADIFTSVYDREATIDLGQRQVNTTILQNIPQATKYFRLLAPLYYPAFRTLDLRDYDLIISSSSSFAKGIKKRPEAKHICFCHNITRFLWDTEIYLQQYSDYKHLAPVIKKIFYLLQKQDIKYAQEPDIYIANSTVVAQRIWQTYRRKAEVINYPISSDKFLFNKYKDDFYLVSSRFLSYKRVDVTIEAFNLLQLPLVIIGDGPERKYLESIAGSTIKFLGYVSDRQRRDLMAKARGVVVSALEDYGLVPVEANASGTPVIAYGAGGVLDTQIHGKTGILFPQQTATSLATAIIQAQHTPWNYADIRNHALNNFSEIIFFDKVEQFLAQVCDIKLSYWQQKSVA